jgi:DNA-binding transcriptional LysR family regulator
MLSRRVGISAHRTGSCERSLVLHGMGVGWVNETARWRCPKQVVILSITDLNMPLPMALAWRKDNTSPLVASFIADVQRLPDVQALSKR